ncbi:hypothetical protein ACCAA_200052 [Candidatus Accumulibacter aalborgensis]|uniref:Uncharacterized protein n=1 Tax=Candidatus Accumulibacter aalborgensis TaxID=1860102 RepID=A0A1A8XMV3_9PROT|nr:hypothetical protein ACCAA_200052 [Candidatus Accumulibacter aalborgensis]
MRLKPLIHLSDKPAILAEGSENTKRASNERGVTCERPAPAHFTARPVLSFATFCRLRP